MKRAVYAGSFDPPTNGHLWMIREAVKLFDELVLAIGINPDKRSTFTVDERSQMLREITSDLPNLRVDAFGDRGFQLVALALAGFDEVGQGDIQHRQRIALQGLGIDVARLEHARQLQQGAEVHTQRRQRRIEFLRDG